MCVRRTRLFREFFHAQRVATWTCDALFGDRQGEFPELGCTLPLPLASDAVLARMSLGPHGRFSFNLVKPRASRPGGLPSLISLLLLLNLSLGYTTSLEASPACCVLVIHIHFRVASPPVLTRFLLSPRLVNERLFHALDAGI